MSSFKLVFFLLAYVFAVLFLSGPAQCKDEEDSVLKGINSYRETLNLPTLNKVDKASCLANELADELEEVPCEDVDQNYPSPGPAASSANPNILNMVSHAADKCDIDINSTIDGDGVVILPVCVAKLEPTVVLSNYTHSDRYAQFLNNSKYTGAGLSSEDDWMVLVLTTNTSAGSFTSATCMLANAAWIEFLLFVLLLVHLYYLDSA